MAKRKHTRKKMSRVGLNSRGRVDWDAPVNLNCLQLSDLGFHGEVISKVTGLTRGQVYGRNRSTGRKLRDYRDGLSGPAKSIITQYKLK